MFILEFVVYDLLGEASLLVGLMALIGLLIQKKSAAQVISGTIKTIVGFLIFGIGSSAAQGALNGFQSLFASGFGLEGVTPISEAITAQAQTLFPMVIALIMVLGFVCNLIIARFTRFKYIFLTGGHSLFLAALLAILLKALGLSDVMAIGIGAIILGLASCIYPAIAQKYMNKVTGSEDIAIGHYCSIAYALSGWIGGKVGNPKKSTESIELPGWLSIFKDYIVSVSLSVGGAICLVNSDNERDSGMLTSYATPERSASPNFLEGQVAFSHPRLSNNRSVMPLDVRGCTRATLTGSACAYPTPAGAGNPLNPIRDGDRGLQLFPMNEEFPVSAGHKLALIKSLPFVHTARRYYRLDGLVRPSDRPRRGRPTALAER